MSALGNRDADWLCTWLKTRTGIALRADQRYLLDARLSPLAAARGVDLTAYVDLIRSTSPRVAQEAVDALTTNETSWLRDPSTFVDLRTTILPSIAAGVRAAGRSTLAVWSAGCSSGQELYSVAMMIADDPAYAAMGTMLDGTDISSRMVAKAREGRYSQLEVDRGLPARQLVTHFTQQGLDWVVSDRIRSMCAFHTGNLLDPPVRRGYDLILARYVLIYFDADARRRVLANLARALNPGGRLMLGGSEVALDAAALFDPEQHGRTTVHRVRDAARAARGTERA